MKSILKPILLSCFLVLGTQIAEAQKKKLKRPSSRVGIGSVDTFVQESFDIYDRVYRYDQNVKAGRDLTDEDIDVLENTLTEITRLTESAPNIISDLDGQGALKQTKATLQINRAKKALKHSAKMINELLKGRKKDSGDDDTASGGGSSGGSNSSGSTGGSSGGVKISTKFDFVPGDKLLFYDDFSKDYLGDFPSQWNTNGTGELIKISGSDEKWLQMGVGYGTYTMPDVASLPEEYTIEFDAVANGLNRQTSSTARLLILLDEEDGFQKGRNWGEIKIPYALFVDPGFRVANMIDRKTKINSEIKADIRDYIAKRHHISIAVNKQRFRLWVDQKKCIDVPRLLPKGKALNAIKLQLHGFKDGSEQVFITNFKVAEGGQDLRGTLLSKGKVSTNGILFDTGSATIKPQSYGILKQISQVLEQESSMKLLIVGHTDSDGSTSANKKLSESRAKAVRKALMDVYGISGNRLTTQGKGESEPIADNSTTKGKSQNRRVEFIKK